MEEERTMEVTENIMEEPPVTGNVRDEVPMITLPEENVSFFQKEDLPRVSHYIINVNPKEEFWKKWTEISVENLSTTNNFDGVIFNNILDYNSGVTFVCMDLSKVQNNTDVYVPYKALLRGVFVIFLTDKHHILRYKLKPDCYEDLDPDVSAQLAGIIADSMKYSTVPTFQLFHKKICTVASEKVTDHWTFFDIFKDHYNNNIKIKQEEKDFAVLYDSAFWKTMCFVEASEKKETEEKFVSMLDSAYSLSKIKEIGQVFNVNVKVNEYITLIIDSLSQFKNNIKSTQSRQELFMNAITANDRITLMITKLQQILINNLDVLYKYIQKYLLLEDLYIDINTVLSVLDSVKVSAPHSTSHLIVNESMIKTQELKKKLNILQKSITSNEELKILKDDAYKFCYSENIEDQQVFWFKNLAKNDEKLRLKATSKKSGKNLLENIKIQLDFEEHYSEYLTLFAKGLSRRLISLPQVIATFIKFNFTDNKTVRDNVVDFLEKSWNIQYWQLEETLIEYQKNIDGVIQFHYALTSNTDVRESLLPHWPITSSQSKSAITLDKNTYEMVIEKLNKPLPCQLEYQYLPFIVNEFQNYHFLAFPKGTLSTTLIQLWNTRLYHEYNLLKSRYEILYKENKSKLLAIVTWVDSNKQPTFARFYHDLQQIAFKDNRPFVDDHFQEFVQNTLVVQKKEVFNDLAQLVSNYNQPTYNLVRQMGEEVYLKKLHISSQEVFEKVFDKLLQQVYLKLRKYKVFKGVLDNLGTDFVALATEFANYYYPRNIIGDIIRVDIVEKKTNVVVSEISEIDFKSQTENIGIAISTIFTYNSKLFIDGLLKWLCHQTGEWLLLQTLHSNFQSQFPENIEFHDINILPATHIICLFLTVSFMLFSNKDIVPFIKSTNPSDLDIVFHVEQLTKTMYTFIKPYFLIKENVQGADHFRKSGLSQNNSLNICISSIYNQDIMNDNLNFSFKDNYNSFFNLFITEAQNQKIQLDINFFLNNNADSILIRYVQRLQSLNSTCISKLDGNVIFNKDHAFTYIHDNHMVYCNDAMRLCVSQEVLNNIHLYQCTYVFVDDYDYQSKKEIINLNPFDISGTGVNILQGIPNEEYCLYKAMEELSLSKENITNDIVIDEEQFEKEKQNLIDIVQNESVPTIQCDNENVIPETSGIPLEGENIFDDFILEDQFIDDDSFIMEDPLIGDYVNKESIYNVGPLSVNNTISSVPCVVSINNPLILNVVPMKKKYVPIIVHNRDRDLIKHLSAVLWFFPRGTT